MNKPGMMFYFDKWEPMTQLPDAEFAALVRAALSYGQNGIDPGFSGVHAALWSMIQAEIDRDDMRFQKSVWQKKYAVHCREAKKNGKAPVSREEWEDLFEYHPLSSDIERYPTPTPTPTPSPTPSSTAYKGGKPPKESFVPPTVEEVEAYITERGLSFDAVLFVNWYEAKGWMIGKNKMKNWKAAVNTWARKEDKGKLEKPYSYDYSGEDTL